MQMFLLILQGLGSFVLQFYFSPDTMPMNILYILKESYSPRRESLGRKAEFLTHSRTIFCEEI